MLEAKRGHLVGISSLAGYRGLPTSAAYSASKAALSVFLESIRVDLFRTGIKVTDVRPGFIDTAMTRKNKFKMPFLMDAAAAGERIVRAIESEKRVYAFPFPTAFGAAILTLIPRWLYDRFGSRVRG
jgi:short-subunit dehydrogenase